jgi:large subunit ribosomal protein L2
MALKKYKSVTPGQRQLVNIDRSELWKGDPVKQLTAGKSNKSGHNNQGRITIWNRGGGHKKKYRIIDFSRKKVDVSATVERL